jgi:hypothetical protein
MSEKQIKQDKKVKKREGRKPKPKPQQAPKKHTLQMRLGRSKTQALMDTIPNVSRNVSQQLVGLARTLALPGLFDTPRGPILSGANPSSTGHPHMTIPYASRITDPEVPTVPLNGEGFVAVSRNPLFAVVWSCPFTPACHYKGIFNATFNADEFLTEQFTWTLRRGQNTYELNPVWCEYNPTPGSVPVEDSLYGEFNFALHQNGHTWIWNGGGQNTFITIPVWNDDGVSPFDKYAYDDNMQAFVRCYRLNSPEDETLMWSQNWENSTTEYNFLDEIGYFRFELVFYIPNTNGPTNVKVGLTIFSNTDLTHSSVKSRPMPGMTPTDFAAIIRGCRTISTSLLLSNVTKELDLNGQVVCRQFGPAEDPLKHFNSDAPFTLLTSQNYGALLDLKEGAYGFAVPGSLSVYDWVEPFSYNDNFTSVDAVENKLANNHGWLYFAYKHQTAVQASFTFTPCWGVEYTHVSTWIDRKMSRYSAEDYEAACAQLKKVQQFTCNPLHIKDILSGLRSVATGAASVAPTVLRIASKMFPQLAVPGMVTDVADALSRVVG